MALMLFVWEFTGLTLNLLIAQRRAVVVVKFPWVCITFPVAQITSILKMLHVAQRVTKYALRIRGSRCQAAKIAAETTVGLDGDQFKNYFLWENPDLAVEAQEQ